MPVAQLESELRIPVSPGLALPATSIIPSGAGGLVIFAHGAGSSRLSPRNTAVATWLRDHGSLGTVLFDLLTPAEDVDYRMRFDIPLLARRLATTTRWIAEQPFAQGLALGYFGASTGAAAAFRAAAAIETPISAIVSRGGRPDMASDVLPDILTPTLLIVGGDDEPVIALNRQAFDLLGGEKAMEIIPGATHLFEEPGALEQVARLGEDWFERHLTPE